MKIIFILFCICYCESSFSIGFLRDRQSYQDFLANPNSLVVASIGRSGSSMLQDVLLEYATPYYQVTKTHLLPPTFLINGKIIFIFGDPNASAQSVCEIMFKDSLWIKHHFSQIETSDMKWLYELDSMQQTIDHNLLNYDALGYEQHLQKWLQTQTVRCEINEAQILAIKYENLWDVDTIQSIKSFLQIPFLELPLYKPRGTRSKMNEILTDIKTAYNQGTEDNPHYEAYKKATMYWEQAPNFQYLKIVLSQ